jgi:hypothetical protein
MQDHELGTTCERCGVHHRVVESLPNRPLDDAELGELERACAFVRPVGASGADERPSGGDGEAPARAREAPGAGGGGSETADAETGAAGERAETLVVSTTGATRLLRRDADHGWVVDRERDHDGDADPRTVGRDVFAEATAGGRLPPADARRLLAGE